MEEKANFSRYGKEFQEGLCQLILQDRPFADRIMEVLDLNFLEISYLQIFLKKIIEYRDKYGVHPTYNTMLTIFRTELEEEAEVVQKQVRNYFARIHKSDVEGSDYIKEVSLDFCRKQKLKEAMLESVKLLKSSSKLLISIFCSLAKINSFLTSKDFFAAFLRSEIIGMKN